MKDLDQEINLPFDPKEGGRYFYEKLLRTAQEIITKFSERGSNCLLSTRSVRDYYLDKNGRRFDEDEFGPMFFSRKVFHVVEDLGKEEHIFGFLKLKKRRSLVKISAEEFDRGGMVVNFLEWLPEDYVSDIREVADIFSRKTGIDYRLVLQNDIPYINSNFIYLFS